MDRKIYERGLNVLRQQAGKAFAVAEREAPRVIRRTGERLHVLAPRRSPALLLTLGVLGTAVASAVLVRYGKLPMFAAGSHAKTATSI